MAKCKIDEEWQGLFIGRRYCKTHDVKWDNGGDCPLAVPTVRRRSARLVIWGAIAGATFTTCIAGAIYVGEQGDMAGAVWLTILGPILAFAALTGATE